MSSKQAAVVFPSPGNTVMVEVQLPLTGTHACIHLHTTYFVACPCMPTCTCVFPGRQKYVHIRVDAYAHVLTRFLCCVSCILLTYISNCHPFAQAFVHYSVHLSTLPPTLPSDEVKRWSTQSPNMYTLKATLVHGARIEDLSHDRILPTLP